MSGTKKIKIEVVGTNQIITLPLSVWEAAKSGRLEEAFIEAPLNRTIELYLVAHERDKGLEKIEKQFEPLWEHILKYLFFEDDQSRRDWLFSIERIVQRLQRLKIKGGGLTTEIFYNHLFHNWSNRGKLEVIEKRKKLEKIYSTLSRAVISDEVAWRNLSCIIAALSKIIANKGGPPVKSILDKYV